MRIISFDDLVSGSAGVRVTDDKPALIWAIDLAVAVTGKNRDDAGWVLRNLKPEIFDPVKFTETNLPANGGKKTKLVTFEHALELVMVLPGKIAKEFRVKACDILKRYFAGDASLVPEIEANADRNEPINLLSRQNLKRSGDELELQQRKLVLRREELELLKLEQELQMSQLAMRQQEALLPIRVQAERIAVEERALAQHESIMKVYQSLCPNGAIDDRAMLMFRDRTMNLIRSQLAIENGPDGDPRSVSDIATMMGRHFSDSDMIKIGSLAAAKFRDRYGPKAHPNKHQQQIKGRLCGVNHYEAKDHDLVRDAITDFSSAD